jgi:histidine triad (HIT) family protein
MDCPYCLIRDPEQEVVFESDLVRFLQDRRHQGALKHSGVIIPIKHRETVFDLSDGEIAATFQLLSRVKAWMDREFLPDGYNIGWNCGRVGGQELFHAHLHVIPSSDRSRSRGRESGLSSSRMQTDGRRLILKTP